MFFCRTSLYKSCSAKLQQLTLHSEKQLQLLQNLQTMAVVCCLPEAPWSHRGVCQRLAPDGCLTVLCGHKNNQSSQMLPFHSANRKALEDPSRELRKDWTCSENWYLCLQHVCNSAGPPWNMFLKLLWGKWQTAKRTGSFSQRFDTSQCD